MTRFASFDAAVLSYLVNLKANAVKLTRNGDKADDLVQETIEKALRCYAQYSEGTNLIGWLFTIMQTRHLESIRRNWRTVEDPDGVYAGTLSTPAHQEAPLDLQDVAKAMDRVKPSHRKALLIVAEGSSYEEAAETLGVAVGTIKSSVSRARAHLAEMTA
jgi:RNA polymerase sigma-70 factor (ECF subfamily)